MAFLKRIVNPFRKPRAVRINFGQLQSQPLPYCNGIIQQDFLGRSLAPKLELNLQTFIARETESAELRVTQSGDMRVSNGPIVGSGEFLELEEGGHLILEERGNPPAAFRD